MNINYIIFLIIVSLINISNPVFAQEAKDFTEFSPPATIWFSNDELESFRNNPVIVYAESYRELKVNAVAALKTVPDPVDTIFYEGLVSNHPRRIETVRHLQDMVNLRSCTWVYIAEAEMEYAKKAIGILNAWAKTYEPSGNDVNDNKLEFCFFAFSVLCDLMNPSEKELIANWLAEIAQKQKEGWKDNSGANRLANRLKIVLMFAILKNSAELKSWVDNKSAFLLNECLLSDGSTTDFHQRDAMHYHVSCVDNLLKVVMLYRLFDENQFDRVQKNGGSLRKSVDFVMPYANGEKIHPEWVNTKVELDKKRWQSGDLYYRPGKPWDPAESIKMFSYAAVFDKKYEAIAEKLKTTGINADSWNSLLLKQIEL